MLYFANRSTDSADAYLADGLTEGIITRLSRDNRLTVKSTSAVARLRGQSPPPDSSGRVLRVANLVNGTIARSGHRLRVSVELVRASSGTTLWAGQFDRDDADLFDIQAAIADTVAREIAGRLLPASRTVDSRRPTVNPLAYDRFLQGNYHLARRRPEDVRSAIRDYEEATQLDPSFAAAHARIALAYSVALDWGWPSFDISESIRAALAASGRALELDSTLADSWTARAYALRFANARTYAGVTEAFARALRLAPRDPEALLQYGWSLVGMGRLDSGLSVVRRSVSLDPERTISRWTLGWGLLYARRPEAALAEIDTLLALDSTVHDARALEVWARLLGGDSAGASAAASRVRWDEDGFATAAMVAIQAGRGDSVAARTLAERLVAALPPRPARLTWDAGWTALGLAAIGDAARALEILERIEPQGLHVWELLLFPGFDRIRRDPGLAQFVADLSPFETRGR